MKSIFFISFCLCIANNCHSQILRRIGNDVKNQAEWKVRSKATEKTNQAIDSLLTPNNKNEGSKKETKKKEQASQTVTAGSTITQRSAAEEEGMNMGEGYVTLSLSADEVFKGGMVIITGSSIKYSGMENVEIAITDPLKEKEIKKSKLFDNNSYADKVQPDKAGEYTITVKSSDGKATETKKLKVYDIEVMDDWRNENIEETNKTYQQLEKEVNRVKENISQKDQQQLQSKLTDVKNKKDAAIKLFTSLNTGGGQLATGVKNGATMSSTLLENLSQLNDLMKKQENEMRQLREAAAHQPSDNSICEYIVMLNEACAAFSTFTNFWAKSATAILKNIVLDKGVPKATEIVNAPIPNSVPAGEQANKFLGKYFATALADAESFSTKIGKAGIAADLLQYGTEILMKTYCGVFKGTLEHDYSITYRNEIGVTWWSYSYNTEAAFTLRFPKNNSGGIIKMKGNIEGNATKFDFYQDIEQMDDFKKQMNGRTKLYPVKVYQPIAVPFATSQADALGFGMGAKALGTPSYFNIPVDAEYNVDAGTIKLFVNNAIVDFLPTVKYIYGYIAIAANIPLVTRVSYPINKAKLTLNAVVATNNELTVTKTGTNTSIKGKGNRHIGSKSSPIEHVINYTLSAKNE